MNWSNIGSVAHSKRLEWIELRSRKIAYVHVALHLGRTVQFNHHRCCIVRLNGGLIDHIQGRRQEINRCIVPRVEGDITWQLTLLLLNQLIEDVDKNRSAPNASHVRGFRTQSPASLENAVQYVGIHRMCPRGQRQIVIAFDEENISQSGHLVHVGHILRKIHWKWSPIHRMEEPKSNVSPVPCVRSNIYTNQSIFCWIHRIPCADLDSLEVFCRLRRTLDRAHGRWQASAQRKWVYCRQQPRFMDTLTLSLSAGSTTKGTGCHSIGNRFSDASGFMNAASRLSELITQRSVWLLKTRIFWCE